MDAEILLKGGLIVDGTGESPFWGEVAIKAGKIKSILPKGAEINAATEINVEGLVVAPGFIDIHSHSDLVYTLPKKRQLDLFEGRIRQGITTEIVGNCGLGRFPSTEKSKETAKAISRFLAPESVPETGCSIGDYLGFIQGQGVVTNVGTLVPHGPVMLAAASESKPGKRNKEPLEKAVKLIEESLEQGAFGLSFGLIYPPGLGTSTGEIIRLADPVRRASGIVTFHQRSGSLELLKDSIFEILEVGRKANVHVHLSHEHVQGGKCQGEVEKLLEWSTMALGEGIAYTQDVIPYTIAHTTLLAVYPPWSLARGVKGWLELARDSRSRLRMGEEIENKVPCWPPWEEGNWPTNIIRDVGYESIKIVECEEDKKVTGLSLKELGEKKSASPFDAMTDLLIASKGQVTMSVDGISGTVGNESPLEVLIADPGRAIITDAWEIGRGKPHPGAYGAFPKVFRRYVRERGILNLQQAVRKLTGLPAKIFGLEKRGLLKEGACADIVVFDLEQIRDLSTEESPRVCAEGVKHIFVNGVQLMSGGKILEVTPGRILFP